MLVHRSALAAALAAVLFSSAASTGAVIYVKADASGANNGTSWTAAYSSLQSALTASVSGDEIWVAAGTYKPAAPAGARTATFAMKAGVNMYGGFGGTETSRDQRNSFANVSILSGDLNGNDTGPLSDPSYNENAYHVVTAQSLPSPGPTLDGFRITGGNANGTSPHFHGSGVWCLSSYVRVRSCTVVGNQCSGGGAGLYDDSHAIVEGSRFFGNAAQGAGGGSRAVGGYTTFYNCVFSGNSSQSYGGGIYLASASPSITNCTFSRNTAATTGGGVYGGSSNSPVTNCILWHNSDNTGITASAQWYKSNGSPTMTYCCIEGGWTGAGNISTDPMLVSDTGSDGIAGTLDDDLRTRAGSPARDAGSNGADVENHTSGTQPIPEADVRAARRFVDDPLAPNTGLPGAGYTEIVDMGAYEYNGILVSSSSVVVAEGQSAGFSVSLENQPTAAVTVTTVRSSGDADLTVQSGGSLEFDGSNYSMPQTVTIAAAEDADLANGTALFSVTGTDLPTTPVNARERENDVDGVIYVCADAVPGGNGGSWPNCVADLNAAIALAATSNGAATEVWVKGGTYKPAGPGGDRNASFNLASGIAVYGGFAGNEIDRNLRDIAANPTILSGDLNSDDDGTLATMTDNSRHVVRGSSLAATTILDGFAVKGGNDDSSGGKGGGAYLTSSLIRFQHCSFINNHAEVIGSGGGIYAQNGQFAAIDCLFYNNKASNNGGGVATDTVMDGQHFTSCRFIGNTAGQGGGFYARSTRVTTANCVFSRNTSTGAGGAIYLVTVSVGNLQLKDCTLSENVAGAQGGGVYLFNGASANIRNCIVWRNADQTGMTEAAQLKASSGAIAVHYSCVYAWTGNVTSDQSHNTNADPLFHDPDGADNTLGTLDDDMQILDGSPATDAGDNASIAADTNDLDHDGNISEVLAVDLSGNNRTVDKQNVPPASVTVDMGAYESQNAQQFVITSNPVTVPENGTATFTVHLAQAPASPLVATIAKRSGDAELQVVDPPGGTLTIGTDNAPQAVTLAAGSDCDSVSDSALFNITASGVSTFVLTATEQDSNAAAPLYVNASATGLSTGCSWTNAFTSLQSALDAAVASGGQVTQIWVAKGTYKPSASIEQGVIRMSTFQLHNNLAIYGGFVGNEVTRTARNVALNETIISGDIGAAGVVTDNCYHVVTAGTGLNNTAVLDGFIVEGGYADRTDLLNTDIDEQGAGLNSAGAAPTIRHCVFRNHYANFAGAGIYHGNGAIIIDQCRFENNRAIHQGAAIYGGNFGLITNCDFVGNSSGSSGGAIRIDGCAGCPSGNTRTRMFNCRLIGNVAADKGGAIRLDAHATLQLTNCTIAWNAAATNGAIRGENVSGATLTDCIVWGNVDSTGLGGPPIFSTTGTSTVNWTCIQNGWSGAGGVGIISSDPLLAPDGHLRSGSPCIDAGNPASTNTYADIDGEARVLDGNGDLNARVDLGADEFVDSNNDALPDWWAATYPTAAEPNTDTDGDGYNNREEFERLGTNPMAAPVHVCNACDPNPDGSAAHPWPTLQTALNAATAGDTILVLPETYAGSGNTNLNMLGKAVVLRGVAGAAATLCDGSAATRFIDDSTLGGKLATVDGFAIQNGAATQGAGLRVASRSLALLNAVVSQNQASQSGGGLYASLASLALGGVTIGTNTAVADEAGLLDSSLITLRGPLTINSGTLESRSSWFDGDATGAIQLGSAATFKVTGALNSSPTVIRRDVAGPGQIVVDAGQQLVIDGDAIVNMTGGGSIVLNGKLIAQGDATIQGASVTVRQATISSTAPVQNNTIEMIDMVKSGGEFFVQENAQILDNIIWAEGDRYLDLDPDPASTSHPVIAGNSINVIIKTEPAFPQGTLLELRSRDYECESGGVNPACSSGAKQATVTGRFASEPVSNWVLNRLEIREGAKVTLTNRRGLQYQANTTHPEAMYVKTLALYPGAVLNTGLQSLYYENLVDETGNPLNPAALPGGRRIVDEPLLGFSLGVVKFDDTTLEPLNEYNIRVRTQVQDDNDVQPDPPTPPYEGEIRRIADISPRLPLGDGIMEMRTQAAGKQTATSVAAKAAFARAGDEQITVIFDYLFLDNPDSELAICISDKQDVGVRSFEVARIRPPAAGQPGAVGSGMFGVFYGTFPRVSSSYELNFTRGTYVEVRLYSSFDGQGGKTPARVWINNFDPKVQCWACADLNGQGGSADSADYLVLLADYGHDFAHQGGTDQQCVDQVYSGDNYVDLIDLLAWDALLDPNNFIPSACQSSASSRGSAAPSRAPKKAANPSDRLIISGKTNAPYYQPDAIYGASASGTCSGAPSAPAAGENTRGNGRLIQDKARQVYQLHGKLGLVKLGSTPIEQRRVVTPAAATFANQLVHVGVHDQNGSDIGVPIMDAAFSRTSATTVFVTPVLVDPGGGQCTYMATAQLELTGGGAFNVTQLYGLDPSLDPAQKSKPSPANCNILLSPDLQHLREVEVSADGKVYVLAAQGFNLNDWLLIYDENAGNASEQRVQLSAAIRAPSAMLLSESGDRLYMSSSINSLTTGQTSIVWFSLQGSVAYGGAFPIVYPTGTDAGYGFMSSVTSIMEQQGRLYAVGFTMPRLDPEIPANDPVFGYGNIRATPGLAVINLATAQPVLQSTLGCGDLSLPISATFLKGSPADFDGDDDVDLDDYNVFKACSTRSGLPYDPQSLPPGCTLGVSDEGRIAADLDDDGDVDLNDFGVFQRCYSGDGVQADVHCGS